MRSAIVLFCMVVINHRILDLRASKTAQKGATTSGALHPKTVTDTASRPPGLPEGPQKVSKGPREAQAWWRDGPNAI
eukprot:3360709-Pyramimonas_sp.AAC.1